MSPGYAPVFSLDAHQALLAAYKRSRTEIMQTVLMLASAPFTLGDMTERDDAGRILQVLALSDHVLSYWADHAGRELRIVKLERMSG
jgi:hypothetical protein